MKEKVSCYSVTGDNGKEIFRKILKQGPKSCQNQNRSNIAQSEFSAANLKFDVGVRNYRFRLISFDGVITIRHVLPKWRQKKASPDTKSARRHLSKTVLNHQQKYTNFIETFVEKIEIKGKSVSRKITLDCTAEHLGLIKKTVALQQSLHRKINRHVRKAQQKYRSACKAQLGLIKAG